MDNGGDDFFSYPSIKRIRELAVEKGAGSANNAIKVSNNTPVFVNESMNDVYNIPQGACMAIPVYIFIDGGNSTSIDEIHNDINDNEIYDLTGRRINSVSRKGIYISNGQKIYVH